MKKRLLLLCIACVLVLGLAVNAYAAGEVTLQLVPYDNTGAQTNQIAYDTTFTVRVNITANAGINCMGFEPTIRGTAASHVTANGVTIGDWASPDDADAEVGYVFFRDAMKSDTGFVATMTFTIDGGAEPGDTFTISLEPDDISSDDVDYTLAEGNLAIQSTTITVIDKPACAHPHLKRGEVAAVDAECGKAGHDRYYKCPDCGDCFDNANGTGTAKKPTDFTRTALEHDFSDKTVGGVTYGHIEADPATCEKDGTDDYYYCSICKKMYTTGDTKAPQNTAIDEPGVQSKDEVPHTFGQMTNVTADCTKTGEKPHYECSVCHKIFDQDQKLIGEKSAEATTTWLTVAKTDHTFASETLTNATDSLKGTKAYKFCSVCGLYYADDVANDVDSSEGEQDLSSFRFEPDVKQKTDASGKIVAPELSEEAAAASFEEAAAGRSYKAVDIIASISYDNKDSYTDWSEGKWWPTEGIDIVVPFASPDFKNNTYVILHDKSAAHDGSDVEEIAVTEGDYDADKGGFVLHVDSLSPYAVAWKANPKNSSGSGSGSKNSKNGAPGTGDSTNIALWIALFGIFAVATGTVIVAKKVRKAHN